MSFVRWLALLVLLLASTPGQALAQSTGQPLTVHFFDVGQGDAALIISPTGKTVLIDSGPPDARHRLEQRLRELVKAPLDLAILTHPHLDHLGGMSSALRSVGARRFMDPGFDHPSEAYRDLLNVVGDEVGQVMTPVPNPQDPRSLVTIGLGDGAALTVLWPRVPEDAFLTGTRSDPNSNSIVAKLTYGKTAFLFTGDAEPDTEATLLRKPIDLTSTVLKVAHHGGRHSSTAGFLAAVKPKAAVISVGAKNDYGHPTPAVLERLRAVKATVFRTDQDGEVVATSDGNVVSLRAEKRGGASELVPGGVKAGPVALGPITRGTRRTSTPRGRGAPSTPAEAPGTDTTQRGTDTPRYFSLKGSKVFHKESCRTLKRSKSNRTAYSSRAEAVRERRPAEDCHP
ncbi:MBL fold metallo-hydrolase [Myxococcus sp. AM009]|uniref:ComEC/Rec2 family competence protein n=1 Tax=unclassified Myxococcus TaxID=2648731 RepID=UPI001594F936|nr:MULTISPECIES: ComEC/Rec2 family competence protein [unclassified Myxococcus]NVI97730.1 MBL fold metallo-hydrolase [Myxococcus sp. AM009]NVJ15944.1 MBL fold metallo-hydrolase [Myxococcus sp. AM010]